MSEWTIGAVLDAIADVVPDRTMTVCGDRRSTFAEIGRRAPAGWRTSWPATGSALIASATALENWECGQDRVALIMHNDLYPDMVIGCLKARTVPVNVNYHYTPREVAELLDYVKPARGHLPPLRWARSSPTCCQMPASTCCCRSTTASDAPELPGAVRWMTHWRRAIPTRSVIGLPGRSADDLHRRHDRPAQGRAVATVRHVRVVDGGRRPCLRRRRSTTRCVATPVRRGSLSRR